MKHWTEMRGNEKAEAIAEVYKPGDSAANLSDQLGTTRSAILGVYSRDRDKLGSQVILINCPLPSANSGPRAKANKTRTKSAPPKRKPPTPPSKAETVAKPVRRATPDNRLIVMGTPLNLPLEHLAANGCKWPTSDDAPHLFCGLPRADKKPYCAAHAMMHGGRGTPGERSAGKDLRKSG